MSDFLKKTHTLIGSKVSIMIPTIYRRKPKIQLGRSVFFCIIFLFLSLLMLFGGTVSSTYAIVNPLEVPNNKVGIHIISPTAEEASPAADFANTNGDWGYITFVIEEKDKDVDKWQKFFDDLRRRHLIPLVRIATAPDAGGFWKRPENQAANEWAEFLNKLTWPTKNRYVIIYNEPNHATEWGNTVDATSYALFLNQTIEALKFKNSDFFVLNAGFDASAPQKLPAYQDELSFMQEMNTAVPGIFNKLDGWSSHSYPNPGFVGSPNASGRGTVRTWQWESEILKSLGVTKELPIFITETGWKHSEGITTTPSLPSPTVVGEYYKQAFSSAWNSSRIVAVTPFLLNYQQTPFDHFSFKKIAGKTNSTNVLSAEYPDYHPSFNLIKNMSKVAGQPIQDHQAEHTKGEIYQSLVAGETYLFPITFKNTGQSIWNENDQVKLISTQGGKELSIPEMPIPQGVTVEPGKEHTFTVSLKAPKSGTFDITLQLYSGNKAFESAPIHFATSVKEPVIIQTKASLKWKEDFSGEYLLTIAGTVGNTLQKVVLGTTGKSEETEAKYLLPDYEFDFTLYKPFYKPKTIKQTLHSGVNVLDFGQLEPNLSSAILNPQVLWNLLPLSR